MTLIWIVLSGVAMSAIALVGGLTLFWRRERLRLTMVPLVAFAAGTLIGGALFHMLPGALAAGGDPLTGFAWTAAGFVVFFALEQFLHWHHCDRGLADPHPRPMTYLILVGDALHNLLGGMAVAGAFVIDVRLGLGAWLAAAAHEVPQELGDFAVLVHGGWPAARALRFNVLSASTFLLGGLLTYALSLAVDVTFLLPFAAGNFLYIAASDLVPEVTRSRRVAAAGVTLAAFCAGLVVLYLLRVWLEG